MVIHVGRYWLPTVWRDDRLSATAAQLGPILRHVYTFGIQDVAAENIQDDTIMDENDNRRFMRVTSMLTGEAVPARSAVQLNNMTLSYAITMESCLRFGPSGLR